MKKVLVSIVVFFLLLVLAAGFTSCSKTSPVAANKPSVMTNASLSTVPVAVEYRITSESANVTVNYLAPDANGNMVEMQQVILRTTESINIDIKSGNPVSIKAWNSDGERKEITVEILANGEIFTAGSLNHLSGIAEASGTIE